MRNSNGRPDIPMEKTTELPKVHYGIASVWFCDPQKDEADKVVEDNSIAPGCGFFGFYKPEYDSKGFRPCPGCGNIDTYKKLPHLAKMEVIRDNVMQRM